MNTQSSNAAENGGLATTGNELPLHNPGNDAYYQDFNAGLQDVFLVKFSPGNRLEWATYFGSDAHDQVHEIHYSQILQNVYIVGNTDKASTTFTFGLAGLVPTNGDFPLINNLAEGGFFEASTNSYISRFTREGILTWSTNMEEMLSLQSVSSPPNGRYIYTAGLRKIDEFNNVDLSGYVYMFNEKNIIEWQTPLGSNFDYCNHSYNSELYQNEIEQFRALCKPEDKLIDIACDKNQVLYITGTIVSSSITPQIPPGSGLYYSQNYSDYPGGTSIISEAFLIAYNAIHERIWATYWGGKALNVMNQTLLLSISLTDIGIALSCFESDYLYMAGHSFATNGGCYPFENPGPQSTPDGIQIPWYQTSSEERNFNAFIARFDMQNVTIPLSVTTADGNNKLLVFPNPSEGSFMVQLPKGFNGNYYVYNILGQLITSGDAGKDQLMQINLKGNSSGLYMIGCVDNNTNEIITSKLILR
jgi:hypothetical protein